MEERRMKKKMLCLLIIITIIALCGCAVQNGEKGSLTASSSKTSTTESTTQTTTQDDPFPDTETETGQNGMKVTILSEDGTLCTLELGMKEDEVLARLDAAGIEVKSDDEVNSLPYHSYYNKGYSFTFDNTMEKGERLLKQIVIYHPDIETEYGIKIGDSEKYMQEIYGVAYRIEQEEEWGGRYHYYEDDGYFLAIRTYYAQDIGKHLDFENIEEPQYVNNWRIGRIE